MTSFQVEIPSTIEGMEVYLSSSLIKGIGPVTAKRIVEKFGESSLEVLENTPERLLEIKGITEQKLDEIKRILRAVRRCEA